MSTTDEPTPLESIVDALSSGEAVSFNVTVNATPDGGGIAFSGQVAPGQSQPILPPVIVPPIIIPPVPPPVVTPPVIPPVIPPPVIPPVVPITTPPQFATTTHPVPIPSTLKTAFPYPTNSWWENIILGKNRIAPEPYQIQVVDNGFLVCYPTQAFAQDSFGMQHITTQFLQNFTLEFAEVMGSWAVVGYDDLTVTLKWTAANGQSATSVIAQGCPYMSMAYTGTTPLLTTMHAITSVNSFTAMGPYSGSKFKITLNNGQTWVVYCSSSLAFTVTGNQLKASAPFTGVIRLACLVNASDESILDQYVTAIPTGGTVTAQYGSTNIVYTFNWTVAGAGQLLMCALPHHMDIMQSPTKVPTSYRSIKGMTTGVVGNSWAMVEPMPTIQWTAPRGINPAYKDAIAAQLKKDASITVTDLTATYEGGKQLAQLARLALVADEIGDTTSATTIRTNLKTALTTWLSGSGPNPLVYETTWGGITSKQALANNSAQYGNGWYNDVVYHYGYMVFSAAVLAKGDSAWMDAYKERVMELIHNYGNPDASDGRFTPHRQKDWYAGHSWAAGLFDFGDNRDTESTSESINGYGGMYLWGLVTGDTATQNYGALLMMTEIRSAKRYWHVYPANNVYGSQWTNGGCGMLWSTKADDSTWFASQLSCRRGIQVIPITQFSSLYLEPAWVQNMVAIGEMTKMQSENFGIWPTFVNALLAVVDKQTAGPKLAGLTDAQIDPGTTSTNLLWWISVMS